MKRFLKGGFMILAVVFGIASLMHGCATSGTTPAKTTVNLTISPAQQQMLLQTAGAALGGYIKPYLTPALMAQLKADCQSVTASNSTADLIQAAKNDFFSAVGTWVSGQLPKQYQGLGPAISAMLSVLCMQLDINPAAPLTDTALADIKAAFTGIGGGLGV